MGGSGPPYVDGGGTSVDALDAILQPVDELLERFLAERIADLVRLDPALEPIGTEVAGLVAAGGKRLRPAFVYWGYRAAGADDDKAILAPAGAVELLHTFALIHDDVMDRSPQRRGRRAVHTAMARRHRRDDLRGDSGWFGMGAAILAGDLAFVWSDQLFDGADLPADALDRGRRVYTQMRTEVMAGQYLDLRLAGLRGATEAESLHVALLKSARYTVTRPLQLGAAIAGSSPRLDQTLSEYGDSIGIAFQLRDDILGLFGDPETTGKGSVSDLREGKRTLLILHALQRCSTAAAAELDLIVGDPHLDEQDAERARDIIVESGALASVEAIVDTHLERAHTALEGVADPAQAALAQLADLAAYRSQ
jgi:geranylgeranyl diphosphate synthase type I